MSSEENNPTSEDLNNESSRTLVPHSRQRFRPEQGLTGADTRLIETSLNSLKTLRPRAWDVTKNAGNAWWKQLSTHASDLDNGWDGFEGGQETVARIVLLGMVDLARSMHGEALGVTWPLAIKDSDNIGSFHRLSLGALAADIDIPDGGFGRINHTGQRILYETAETESEGSVAIPMGHETIMTWTEALTMVLAFDEESQGQEDVPTLEPRVPLLP